MEYTVKLKTQFKARLNATGVEIKLPGAGDATSPEVKVRTGERHVRPGAGGDAVEDQDRSRREKVVDAGKVLCRR